MTNKRAIQWLEMYANRPVKWDDYSDESREVREEAEKQIAEAFRMAVDALKAQEAVAVIPAVKKDGELLHEGNCSVCGMKLDWFYNGNYCGCCGSAVKWK